MCVTFVPIHLNYKLFHFLLINVNIQSIFFVNHILSALWTSFQIALSHLRLIYTLKYVKFNTHQRHSIHFIDGKRRRIHRLNHILSSKEWYLPYHKTQFYSHIDILFNVELASLPVGRFVYNTIIPITFK